jgi:hypothetical protein
MPPPLSLCMSLSRTRTHTHAHPAAITTEDASLRSTIEAAAVGPSLPGGVRSVASLWATPAVINPHRLQNNALKGGQPYAAAACVASSGGEQVRELTFEANRWGLCTAVLNAELDPELEGAAWFGEPTLVNLTRVLLVSNFAFNVGQPVCRYASGVHPRDIPGARRGGEVRKVRTGPSSLPPTSLARFGELSSLGLVVK